MRPLSRQEGVGMLMMTCAMGAQRVPGTALWVTICCSAVSIALQAISVAAKITVTPLGYPLARHSDT